MKSQAKQGHKTRKQRKGKERLALMNSGLAEFYNQEVWKDLIPAHIEFVCMYMYGMCVCGGNIKTQSSWA